MGWVKVYINNIIYRCVSENSPWIRQFFGSGGGETLLSAKRNNPFVGFSLTCELLERLLDLPRRKFFWSSAPHQHVFITRHRQPVSGIRWFICSGGRWDGSSSGPTEDKLFILCSLTPCGGKGTFTGALCSPSGCMKKKTLSLGQVLHSFSLECEWALMVLVLNFFLSCYFLNLFYLFQMFIDLIIQSPHNLSVLQ